MWPQTRNRIIEGIYPINGLRNNGVFDAFIVEDRPRRQHIKKKVMDYIETIKKRAEKTNGTFIQKNLPYRLRVYAQKKRAFIEISSIQGDSKTRDITNDDFNKLMDNITTGTGLIFDS